MTASIYNLKSIVSNRLFEKLFIAILFALRILSRRLLGSHKNKIFFSYLILLEMFELPYLLVYDDFYSSHMCTHNILALQPFYKNLLSFYPISYICCYEKRNGVLVSQRLNYKKKYKNKHNELVYIKNM